MSPRNDGQFDEKDDIQDQNEEKRQGNNGNSHSRSNDREEG